MTVDEEARAEAEVWNYAYGFIRTEVVKAAVELQIPDVLEKHGGAISLSDLSTAVGCPSEKLYRIMRFLIHHRIFKRAQPSDGKASPPVYYAQTPLSRLLAGDKMAPFIQLHGTPPGPAGGLTAEALRTGKRPDLKSVIGDEDTWTDNESNLRKSTFTDAMNANARVTASAIIRNYPEAFGGIRSLVDVGGRHGMALSFFVKAFPWVRGIAFDLPDVVDKAPPLDGIDFVGGSMFDHVPQADAVMLMRVLHDWSDKACIEILKKCKVAIPAETGKVMIVDAVVDEEEEDEYAGARLLLDMVMMAVTVQGKERTYKEWTHLLNEAGFSRHTVKNIGTAESVIEAYP